MDHIKDLQEVAIRTLASPRFDPAGSRRVLSNVLKKFPERKSDVVRRYKVSGRGQNQTAAGEPEPAGWLTDKSNISDGWLRSLTYALGGDGLETILDRIYRMGTECHRQPFFFILFIL